jgi:hypothetical protein
MTCTTLFLDRVMLIGFSCDQQHDLNEVVENSRIEIQFVVIAHHRVMKVYRHSETCAFPLRFEHRHMSIC